MSIERPHLSSHFAPKMTLFKSLWGRKKKHATTTEKTSKVACNSFISQKNVKEQTSCQHASLESPQIKKELPPTSSLQEGKFLPSTSEQENHPLKEPVLPPQLVKLENSNAGASSSLLCAITSARKALKSTKPNQTSQETFSPVKSYSINSESQPIKKKVHFSPELQIRPSLPRTSNREPNIPLSKTSFRPLKDQSMDSSQPLKKTPPPIPPRLHTTELSNKDEIDPKQKLEQAEKELAAMIKECDEYLKKINIIT